MLIFAGALTSVWYFSPVGEDAIERPNIRHLSSIQALFPKTPASVEQVAKTIESETRSYLQELLSVAPKDRTFQNTFIRLDEIMHRFMVIQNSLYVISATCTDGDLRKAAQLAVARLHECSVDFFSVNNELYKACLHVEQQEERQKYANLSAEARYFMKDIMDDFRRNGMNLSSEKRERITWLTKEIGQLALAFEAAYTVDKHLVVSKEALTGLEESFIKSLARTEHGLYKIPLTSDKLFSILEQAMDQQTRKKVYQAYMQRGYPENEPRLTQVLKYSAELASHLGFKSYAHLSLSHLMAGSPEVVDDFLATLYKRSSQKALKEFSLITAQLPPGVMLEKGKLHPWDLVFTYNWYKKHHLDLDEASIAHYFPCNKTLRELLKVYEDFFDICFTSLKKVEFWHDDVQAFAVYQRGKYLGMLLLDIFARPGKFSHAGHMTVAPAVKDRAGKLLPAVVVVVANFPPEHPERPSLLRRNEVLTFFHECGHALHALFGATEFASLSGTSVKADFVEMPSQMLEEWLWDQEILKAISSHDTTGKPLPDEVIQKILQLKRFDIGDFMLRQLFLAEVSLELYRDGGKKPLAQVWKSFNEQLRPTLVYDESNKSYCSFPHIMGYGPRYYGYLWSKVFAHDLFSVIKHGGLRNPEMGSLYQEKILSKGGSKNPNELLQAFLGRKPSSDAFFKDLGL